MARVQGPASHDPKKPGPMTLAIIIMIVVLLFSVFASWGQAINQEAPWNEEDR